MEWKSVDLSNELSLKCGVNVNYYKSVYQTIPTRESWEYPDNFRNESVSSAFNWVLPFFFENEIAIFQPVIEDFWKAQVSFPSNFASICSVIKHNFSILFLAQALYAMVKSVLLKCKVLGFLSAWVKICQIPHVNFELASQFLFRFCIILHCNDTKLPCKF